MIRNENNDLIVEVVEQEWDSSIFGFKCGLLNIIWKGERAKNKELIDDNIRRVIIRAGYVKYKFLTAKISSEETLVVNSCLKNKGKLIDTELSLCKAREIETLMKNVCSKEISFQKHKEFWSDSFLELSQTIGLSRFFLDENISSVIAHKLWQQSIFNSCNGRASYSIICFFKNTPVGLMNIFEKNNVSDIFIIAVLPNFQKQGLGKAMMQFYEKNLCASIKQMTVDTQLINYRAHSFYTKLGFKIINAKHIIHFWL